MADELGVDSMDVGGKYMQVYEKMQLPCYCNF